MPNKAKAKTKPRTSLKNVAKAAAKSSKPIEKSGHKASKPSIHANSHAHGTKAAAARPAKQSPRQTSATKLAPSAGKAPPAAPQKLQVPPISGALKSLEAGIKLMYAEQYDKAMKCFNALIADFPEEVEVQASARAHVQACEKKIHDRARAVIRSSEDHYHMAVAFLNGGQVDSAMNHLQQALKLEPKGGHILYAIAAANALKGNKEQALSFL